YACFLENAAISLFAERRVLIERAQRFCGLVGTGPPTMLRMSQERHHPLPRVRRVIDYKNIDVGAVALGTSGPCDPQCKPKPISTHVAARNLVRFWTECYGACLEDFGIALATAS